MIVLRALLGLLLMAHGLVHLLYLAKDAPEFSTDQSWLIPRRWRQPVARSLIAATILGFALLALAVWHVPGLSGSWPTLAITASSLSTLLLVAFWNRRLTLGLLINAALIAVALAAP